MQAALLTCTAGEKVTASARDDQFLQPKQHTYLKPHHLILPKLIYWLQTKPIAFLLKESCRGLGIKHLSADEKENKKARRLLLFQASWH